MARLPWNKFIDRYPGATSICLRTIIYGSEAPASLRIDLAGKRFKNAYGTLGEAFELLPGDWTSESEKHSAKPTKSIRPKGSKAPKPMRYSILTFKFAKESEAKMLIQRFGAVKSDGKEVGCKAVYMFEFPAKKYHRILLGLGYKLRPYVED